MQPEERQKRIEEHLIKAEFASLEELAQKFGASVSTIRRDLTILEATGLVRRTHGGGRIMNPGSEEFTFDARDTHELAEKEAIGRVCAELIKPRQTLILDAGTTVYHVARYLAKKEPQIITNSLPVANLFVAPSGVEVIVSGGIIHSRLGVLVGPLAVKTFSEVHADVAIMSGGGLTLEGITNSHALLIAIQHQMIRAAQKVIICLDHTKFGRKSVVPMCELDDIDTIITDAGAPLDMVEALRARGIEVLIAPANGAPPSPAPRDN